MELSDYYTNIIHRYLSGAAEKTELVELLEWLKSSPENNVFFNQVCAVWELSAASVNDRSDTDLALMKLNQKIKLFESPEYEMAKPGRITWISWFRNVAAVFVALFAVAFLFRYLVFPSKEKPVTTEYVMAYAPPSQKSQIILSDGTVVWLNSGTRIKYATTYGLYTREVYLEGEAFFKVAKNPKMPFLVHASSITVRAMGTSFNVKCYASDKTIETTLIEGQVQVGQVVPNSNSNTTETVLLDPNEKAVYSKENNEIKIARFGKPKQVEKAEVKKNVAVVYVQKTVQSEVSWKEQQLVFENEAFEDLAKRLERWYNVNIRINDNKLLKNRYTGKFVNNEPLEQVLRVIEKTTPISYTLDKDNVVIDSKK